jgi:hypothetical protein
MGRPTGVLANELSVPILIVAYLLTYHTPLDIGYKFGNTLLFRLIATPFTCMFKTSGTAGYSTAAFYAFKDNASKLYSIPVVAPILYPTLLGNMGAFFTKGFHGHLKNGMPWAFQNGTCRSTGCLQVIMSSYNRIDISSQLALSSPSSGLFAASFFHFFVHDEDGPIGTALRAAVRVIPGVQMGLDDWTFAMVFIAVFMQVMGFLQFPELLGPSFSPFVSIRNVFERILVAIFLRTPSRTPVELTTNGKVWQGAVTDYTKPKKKKNRKKTQ